MNLSTMTLQEIFDKSATHLLTQNRKSMRDREPVAICAYRGLDDAKCAIGCMIDDEDYHVSMEGKGVRSNTVLDALGLRVKDENKNADEKVKFLQRLQSVHDDYPVYEWINRLHDVAGENALAFNGKVP